MTGLDIGKLSDGGLNKLHDGVRRAFDEDEKTQEEKEKPFGVLDFSDRKVWSDALEYELDRRRDQAFESSVVT